MAIRRPPVALPSAIAAGNGYGDFRAKQVDTSTGRPGVWHWGLDLANAIGADVDAPEDMTITHVWTDNETAPFVGYGPGGVLGRGASGLYHLLAHMDPTVAVGNVVQAGDVVGHTGELAGITPHCHWEVRVKPIDSPATRKGNTLDPRSWLAGATSRSGDWGWLLVVVALVVVSRRR